MKWSTHAFSAIYTKFCVISLILNNYYGHPCDPCYNANYYDDVGWSLFHAWPAEALACMRPEWTVCLIHEMCTLIIIILYAQAG